MEKPPKKAKGWKGQPFEFGNGLADQAQTPEESDIAVYLFQHIEELAFGGYRASHGIDDEMNSR